MSWTDWVWFQGIKIILPLVWEILPKESQRDILQELWAWQEVLKFRNIEIRIFCNAKRWEI